MWQEQDNRLIRTFIFKDFSEAFSFMTRVAMLAEQQAHHPNWSNVWNTVIIELTTGFTAALVIFLVFGLEITADELLVIRLFPVSISLSIEIALLKTLS